PEGRLAVAASETLRGLEAPLEAEVRAGRVFYRKAKPPPEEPPPRAPGPAAAARPARAGRRRIATPPPIAPSAPAAGAVPLAAAVAMARAGQVRGALDLLRPSVGEGPANLSLLLTVGHLHLRLHEIGEAVAAYRAAAEGDPLSCEVHFFEGIAHRKAGDWAAAAEALRRALFLAPTMWQAAYALAGAYERLDRPREASRERARARRLLAGGALPVAFLSDPLFIDWLSIDEASARRLLGLA